MAAVHWETVTSVRQQRQMNMAVFSVLSIALISTGFMGILASRPVVTAEITSQPVELPAPLVRWTATVQERTGRTTAHWTMQCDGDSGKDNLAIWCRAEQPHAAWTSLSMVTHGPDISVNIGGSMLMTASADADRITLTTDGLRSTGVLTTLGAIPTPTNRIPSGPGLGMIADGRIAFDGNYPQDRRGTHTVSVRIDHTNEAITVRYAIGTLDPDGRRVVIGERSGTITFRPGE